MTFMKKSGEILEFFRDVGPREMVLYKKSRTIKIDGGI